MTLPVTPIDPNAIYRTKQLVDNLLERGHFEAVGSTLDAIGVGADRGRMAASLNALQMEAQRLSQAGLPLSPDNPVFRVFQADLDDFLRSTVVLIDGSAETLQAVGVQNAATLTRQLALGSISDEALRLVGVTWNQPDPDALVSLIRYVDSPEWEASLSRYQGYINGIVEQHFIRDFAMGVNPMRTVDDLVMLMRGRGDKPPLTVSAAESLTRTLINTAYRDSTALHQVANADIIDYVIRIAALDHRTCLSCIALHGTRLEVGERVDDHRRGRCTSIAVIKGRPRSVESGESWLNSRPEADQEVIMGGANYRAYKDGAVQLQEFVHKGTDPIFGDIVQEQSLKGILGDGAQRYYQRNQ